MHQRIFSFRNFACFAIAACLVGLTQTAHATTTLISASNYSNAVNIGAQSPVIYGGVAGPACSTDPAGHPCSSCADSKASGDSNLRACNDQRIYNELILYITVKNDAGGNLLVVNPTNNGSTVIPNSGATTITKGGQATVALKWQDVCSNLSPPDGSNLSNCDLTTAQSTATGTIRVGIPKNGNVLDSSGDFIDITVTVIHNIGQIGDNNGANDQSVIPDCENATATQYGVCDFVMSSSDGKGVLSQVKIPATSGAFPVTPNVTYTKFRLFYYKATAPVNQDSTQLAPFDQITPISPHADLAITGDSTSGVNANPNYADGLENDQMYYFRTALIDIAGNVGYYTSQAAEAHCDTTLNPHVTDGTGNCHVAYPGEVVGILTKNVNCFIATASYGSVMAPEVKTFRQFRNRFLLPTSLGRSFVHYYNKYSPPLAAFIAKSEILRAVSRAILTPPLYFVKLALRFGIVTALCSLLAIFILPFLALHWILRPRRRTASGA